MFNSVKDVSSKEEANGPENCENTNDRPVNHLHHDDVNVDWKQAIEANFKIWVEELSSYDNIGSTDGDEPDLYSFYEELSALRSEFRKSARRSHDSFSRFGETLLEFDRMIKDLLAGSSENEKAKEKAALLSKKEIFLPLVEMFERFKRVEYKMKTRPQASLFSARRTWNKAWSNLHEGLVILRSHFEELLKKEGITAIDARGKPFDPSLMTAVEAEETDKFAPNTVLDVFSEGYLYQGYILKLAEVKVSKG